MVSEAAILLISLRDETSYMIAYELTRRSLNSSFLPVSGSVAACKSDMIFRDPIFFSALKFLVTASRTN